MDSIAAGEQRYFTGRFGVTASTPLGTVLAYNASISPSTGFTDSEPFNNADTMQAVVVGSFDPNDKQVDPVGIGPMGIVLHDTRLNYRIRFQNTGTASAIHIIVTDTIDANLDMSSFLMHQASHPYTMTTNGRVITWKFLYINLPDSSSNLYGSMGFIEFSINPADSLADGTVVTNNANIYFDFNLPVQTNTTINTFQSTLVSVAETDSDIQLQVYPVPAGDYCYIVPNGVKTGAARIELYDLTGRVVQKLYDGNLTEGMMIKADLTQISSGYYIVRLISESGNKTVPIIRQ